MQAEVLGRLASVALLAAQKAVRRALRGDEGFDFLNDRGEGGKRFGAGFGVSAGHRHHYRYNAKAPHQPPLKSRVVRHHGTRGCKRRAHSSA